MKSALLIITALASQSAWASPLGSAKTILSDPAHEIYLVSKFLFEFFGAAVNDSPQDPLIYEDFYYDLSYIFSSGGTNMTNAQVHGLSNFQRKITINKEIEEITFSLSFPEIIFDGSYNMKFQDGFCWPGLCKKAIEYYLGNGLYKHTFWNVTLNATFTLDHSTDTDEDLPSIRYTPHHFLIEFEQCSLYAENFTHNGVPQTNWEERSELFKINFVDQPVRQYLNKVIFGEVSATLLSIVTRIETMPVEEIYEYFEGLGAEILP